MINDKIKSNNVKIGRNLFDLIRKHIELLKKTLEDT